MQRQGLLHASVTGLLAMSHFTIVETRQGN